MIVTKFTESRIKGHAQPESSYHYELQKNEELVIIEAIQGVLDNGDGSIWIREIYAGNEDKKWLEFKEKARNLKVKLGSRKKNNILVLSEEEHSDFENVVAARDLDLYVTHEDRSESKCDELFWATVDKIASAHKCPRHKIQRK